MLLEVAEVQSVFREITLETSQAFLAGEGFSIKFHPLDHHK
jgi:hypothetical protein